MVMEVVRHKRIGRCQFQPPKTTNCLQTWEQDLRSKEEPVNSFSLCRRPFYKEEDRQTAGRKEERILVRASSLLDKLRGSCQQVVKQRTKKRNLVVVVKNSLCPGIRNELGAFLIFTSKQEFGYIYYNTQYRILQTELLGVKYVELMFAFIKKSFVRWTMREDNFPL